MFLINLLLVDNLTVLPYAYRRIRTAEFWVMRTPQTPYQQVCKRFRAPAVLPRIELGSDKAVLTV